MIKKLMICPWFGPLPPWFDAYLANIELLKPLGYDWHITTNLNLFKERVGDILGIKCPIVPGTGKLWDYRPAFGVLFAEEIKRYDYWGHTDFDCVYGRVDRFVTDEFLGLATPPIESRRDPAVDPRGRWICTCHSHQFVQCRGKETLGAGWACADEVNAYGERPETAPLPPETVSPTKKPLDIHSNHHNYMCGPWSLYRNRDEVNALFQLETNWQNFMTEPEPNGWGEKDFTAVVDWAAQQGTITRKYTHWQGANPGNTDGLFLGDDGGLMDCSNGIREIMMFHFRHTKEYPKGVKFV